MQLKHQWAPSETRVRKQKIQHHVFPALNRALGSPLPEAASGKRIHAVQPVLTYALAVLQLPFQGFEASLLSKSEMEKTEVSGFFQ